jgi:filamentous hemagglutinin
MVGFAVGADSKPSLLDPKGETHVLDGDGPNAGGGHRNGTNKPGKSEFPANWSDDKIKGEISDIATDPKTQWSRPDARGYVTGNGTRDGVDVRVVYDTKNGRIVTGYPTNLGGNP